MSAKTALTNGSACPLARTWQGDKAAAFQNGLLFRSIVLRPKLSALVVSAHMA